METERPEFAGRDHLARLPHHGVAGVVEGDEEAPALRVGQRHQRLGLRKRDRQRLVADHVDAGLEERRRDRRVQVVRRDDDDRLDAVGPGRLGAGHLAPVGIGALGRDAELGGRGGGVLRIGRQRPRDERDPVVEPHGEAVHRADEGIAPAAHHADPQPVGRRPSGGCIDHAPSSPRFEAAFHFSGCGTAVPRYRGAKADGRKWVAKHRVLGISFDHMHMGDLLRQVAEHPDAEIAGIFDPDRARMANAVATFAIPDERVFTDLDACLAVGADLAIVCSATARHAETVEAIAPHGISVMVEKPFAASAADARRMIAAMEGRGRLAVNWPLAWYPSHNTAKRLVDEGAIGELIEVHFYDGNRGPLYHLADKVEVSPEEVERQKPGSWWYKRASRRRQPARLSRLRHHARNLVLRRRGAHRGDERRRRDPRHRGRPAFDHRRPLRPRPLQVRDALGHAHRPLDHPAAAALRLRPRRPRRLDLELRLRRLRHPADPRRARAGPGPRRTHARGTARPGRVHAGTDRGRRPDRGSARPGARADRPADDRQRRRGHPARNARWRSSHERDRPRHLRAQGRRRHRGRRRRTCPTARRCPAPTARASR